MQLVNPGNKRPQGIEKGAEQSQFLRQLATVLSGAAEALDSLQPSLGEEVNFYEEVCRFETTLIERALRKTRGNQAKAARLLHLKQTTLHGKIKQYRINPPFVGYYPEEPSVADTKAEASLAELAEIQGLLAQP